MQNVAETIKLLPNVHEENCTRCKLCNTRTNIVPSYLPETTQVLFVAEAPSEVEDVQGLMPATGRAGNFLDECIAAAGYDRSDPAFGFTYAVKCRPVDEEKKSRPLKDAEVNACNEYLLEEIRKLPNLKVIICLGQVPFNAVIGKLGLGMYYERQFAIWHKKHQAKIVTTYHPAAFLYATSFQEKNHIRKCLVEDIQKAVNLLAETYTPMQHTAYVCDTIDKVKWLFKKLNEQTLVAWDTETDALDYLEAEILCHSFSWIEGMGAVLPLLGQYSKPFWKLEEREEIDRLLKEFLENPNIKKIAQNGKFDIQQCKAHGINVQNFHADTMLMHYLVNENIEHGLKLLAWLYTDQGGYEEELDDIRAEYAKKEGISKKEASFNIIPNDILWEYSSMDPDVTLQVYNKLLPILQKENTIGIFEDLYMPFTQLVADMEFQGMSVDREYLIKTREEFKNRIKGFENRIYRDPDVKRFVESRRQKYREGRLLKWQKSKTLQKRVTQEEYCEQGIEEATAFNYGSDKQLKELFIDQLKLKVGKRTKGGGPSFDKEAMEVYAKKVPLAKLIADANKSANLLTTFIDGILDRIRKDGKVHTSLNLQITDTGRISSSGPNLQNIPNKTNNPVDAKLIRDIYVADSVEHNILEFDMAQNEFRQWAQLSQDPVMIEDLANGLDIHTEIASKSFNVPKDKVTKDLRNGAKGVVFGKMYGRGNKSVSEQLGISIKDAEKIEAALFSKYKVASAWLKKVVQEALRDQYVINLFGFRRHLDGLLNSFDLSIKSAVERLAVNSPIQGGASQMVCYAMLKIDKAFKENNIKGRLLFPIHDAILFSIHKDDIKRAMPLIEEGMVHPHPIINVPLGIDGKIGYRWGSAQPVEEYLKNN